MSGPKPTGAARRGRLALLVACVLVGGPIVLTVGSAFGVVSISGAASIGLEHVRAVWSQSTFWSDIFHTLVMAVGGTLVAIVIGTTLAFLLTRTNMPGSRRRAMVAVPLLSFLLPTVLVFFSWHVLYASRAGLVNMALRALPGAPADEGPLDLLTWPWLVGAMAVFLVPIIFITVRGSLSAASPELEQAARVSGASLPRVLRTVTIPLIKPAVAAGGLLALVLGFGAYLIPAMIRVSGWRTVSLDMKSAIDSSPPAYGQAAAWALVLLVLSLVALFVRHRWVGNQIQSMPLRQSAADDAGKRLEIGRWRWAGLGAFGLYGLVAGVLPLIAVVLLSLRPFWGTSFDADDFSLTNYQDLSRLAPGAMPALANSLVLAFVGATASLVIGVWFARRIITGGGRNRFLEAITFVPAAIPPIIVGLSLLVMALRFVPNLYGTMFPVLVAYVVILLPFSVQIPLAALRRIPRELEWASAVSGSSRLATLRRVVLPLVAVDLVGVWVLLAVIIVREIEASIMLSGVNFHLAGPEMLQLWETGSAPAAAAFGIYLLLGTVGLLLLGVAAVGVLNATARLRARRRVAAARALVPIARTGGTRPAPSLTGAGA